MVDLIIRGGRVLDPAQGLDGIRDIALHNGKVAAIAESIPLEAGQTVLEARGPLVTPGLIDAHVHIYEGVSHYGLNADQTCLHQGITTVVDAGSAGAQIFPGLRQHIIELAQTRILAYLNLSVLGMINESKFLYLGLSVTKVIFWRG
jgi:dihydroorotase